MVKNKNSKNQSVSENQTTEMEENNETNQQMVTELIQSLNSTLGNLFTNLNASLTNNLSVINKNLEQLTETVEKNESQKQVHVNQIQQGISGVIPQVSNIDNIENACSSPNRAYIAAFKDLGGTSLYFAPGGSMHPVTFIKKLSKLFNEAGVPDEKKVFFAMQCLRGSAQDWSSLKEESFTDYEQFKQLFFERYWSSDDEREVFNRIKFGTYKNGPKADYFLKMLGESKLLSNSLTEGEQIELIINHFSPEVRKAILNWGVRDADSIEKFLRKLDVTENGEGRNESTAERSNWRENNRQRGQPSNRQQYSNNRSSNAGNGAAERGIVGHAGENTTGSEGRTRHVDERQVNTVFNEPFENILEDDPMEESEGTESLTVLPTIEIEIEGTKQWVLVDTGSQVTCISQTFANQLLELNPELPKLPTNVLTVSGALGKQKDHVREQLYVSFAVGNRIKFDYPCLVIPSLSRKIIFGCDWLNKFNANLDIRNQWLKLWINNEEIQLKFVGEPMPSVHLNIKEIYIDEEPQAVISTAYKGPNLGFSKNEMWEVVAKAELKEDEEKKKLFQLISEYETIFSDQPGRTNGYVHEIVLKDYSPFYFKSYPVPHAYRSEVNRQLEEMLEWGVIKKSPTEYVNPLVVVRKKGGQLRVCLDARHLNSRMVKDHVMPPNPGELLYEFTEGQCLSSLDLTASYWQIPIYKEHQKYTGFSYNGDTYVFQVLPFGLSTSVASFIRGLGEILGEVEEFVIPYVDDLLVYSKDFCQHMSHLKIIFERFRRAGITLKLKKCNFIRKEIKFLGHIITSEGIKMDEDRIDAIQKFPIPRNVKALRSFLGFVNYDRRFCENFAELTAPLLKLLRKGITWNWGAEQTEAMKKIKVAFLETIMLKHPRMEQPFYIQTDASGFAVGGCLFQINTETGDKNYVGFTSKILRGPQLKYTVTEKEAYAILHALKEWRVFVLGRQLTIITDHRALSFIRSCRLLNSRLTRWILYFQEYDLKVVYCKGTDNIIADTISRFPVKREEEIEIPESVNIEIAEIEIKTIKEKFKNLRILQLDDEFCKKIINDLESELCKERIRSWFIIYDGILFRRGNDKNPGFKLCLPKSMLRDVVLYEHETFGHFGREKCVSFLTKFYYFPKLKHVVSRLVSTCLLCQKSKISPRLSGEMGSVMAERPNQIYCLDLMGPLPRARGGVTQLLVVVDAFSKYVCLYALKRATASAILNCLLHKHFVRLSLPESILSDNGTQFTSQLWLNTLQEKGIKVRHTSVYYPQGNLTERHNREIGRIIRAFCHSAHTKWVSMLPKGEKWLNRSYSSSTGYTPEELHFGEPPRNDLIAGVNFPEDNSYHLPSNYVYLAYERLLSKAARRKARHDKGKVITNFIVGDKVLVRTHPQSSLLDKEIKKFF
ncbi:retrovirus-related Pol polyprotein from transposon 17.6 [Leptinotarsa decemlineata]|uniref:retrovirus-related Pol polyprotein from transposon 17.6 n=1 Tax=Leptinotarsa decemlineata TaxID=7539 RepID=UPI003D3081B5